MPPASLPAPESMWDAVIIGAGPAGAVAARELAQRGRAVLLLDRAPFPRWKVCGCCLSALSVRLLEARGLAHVLRHGITLERLRCTGWGRSLTVPLSGGRVLSRERLDAALVEAAVEAGATFRPRTSAFIRGADVAAESAEGSCTIGARAIISADGLSATSLRDVPALAPRISRRLRIGLGTVLPADALSLRSLPRGQISMHCADGGYIGMVRLEDGAIELAAALDPALLQACSSPAAAVCSLLGGAGELRPHLEAARFRGTPALTRSRRAEHGNIFVVGDAAAYIEPFTGEGIGWALASGIAIVPHIERVIAGTYRAGAWMHEHSRIIRRRQLPCRALSGTLRSPRLTRIALRAASVIPGVARSIAARTHGGLARGALR